MTLHKPFLLKEIFGKANVIKGDIHETNILDGGKTPVIGCGFEKEGVEGFFDVEGCKKFKNSITIASDGSYPLTAFYHNYEFSAKDNVVVCIPDKKMSLPTVYYIIYVINGQRWRFSYGRKCYYTKMNRLPFLLPVNDNGDIDHEYINTNIRLEIPEMANLVKTYLK